MLQWCNIYCSNLIAFRFTNIYISQETGAWMAELLITPVNQEDLTKEFALTATNEHGSEVYNIKISFDPTPAEVDG